MKPPMRIALAGLGAATLLSGCAVVSVTGAVVSTGVEVTGKVIGAGIDAVSPSKKPEVAEAEASN